MPSAVPRFSAPASARRRKKRSINSNSVIAAIVAVWRLGWSGERPLSLAPAASDCGARAMDLGRAGSRRKLVEYAVDVLVPIGTAVGLRELDRFVDGHAVRHVGLAQQLPRANGQDALFDRRQLARLAVEKRCERGYERVELADDSAPEPIEKRRVALREFGALGELRPDQRGIAAGEQPLVDALKRELSRAAARANPHRWHPGGWPSPPPPSPPRSL